MPFLSLIIAVFVFYACSHPGILSNNGVESLPTPYIDIANRTPEQDRANRPQTTNEACLPPLITFGFPNGETFLLPPEQEPLLPSGKWKYISTLPQSAESTEYALAFVHSRNTHNEVWVVTDNPKILYQYRTDTQKWTVNKTADVSTASYLFLDDKGDVWSARKWNLSPAYHQTFLRWYDENSGLFIPIYDKERTWLSNSSITTSSVKVDGNETFWMMVEKGNTYQLISFNPSTRISHLHLESPGYGSSIEISPDNRVFLVDQWEQELIVYSPNTEEKNSYDIPVQIKSSTITNLYLDDFMRLWLNDDGWFDFSTSRTPQWFTVVRSPIFIDFLPGAGVWAWGKPVFTTESEGGVLWYSSSRGTGWLDTKDGTWCLFTSYPSNVIKDSESNLWVFVDGKLYTFDMEKQ